MKGFLIGVVLAWALMFGCDYIAVRDRGTPALCQKIVSFPIWYHVIFPGAGNACIDLGFFK